MSDLRIEQPYGKSLPNRGTEDVHCGVEQRLSYCVVVLPILIRREVRPGGAIMVIVLQR